MSEKNEELPVRVFDSVTAAVENSAPPAAPPYAVLPPSQGEQVPAPRKAPEKRTQTKQSGTTAQAGTAAAQAKPKAPAAKAKGSE